MKAYEIHQEFEAISELIEKQSLVVDEETGEVLEDNTELLQELLSDLNQEKEDKVDSICFLIRDAKKDEEFLNEEIKRLQSRKKMFQNKQAKLKELLGWLLDGEKIKTVNNTVSYRNTTSIKIVDESLIPPEYLKVEEKISVDKKALTKALKDFESIEGAELEVKKTLSIR